MSTPIDDIRARVEAAEIIAPDEHSMTRFAPFVSISPEDRDALLARIDTLCIAVDSLLAWAERYRGGDSTLDPEEWYVVSEFAKRQGAGASPTPYPFTDSTGRMVQP